MKWFFLIFFSLSFVFLSIYGLNCFYGYLFPTKYSEEISSACEIYDVDKAVVFSIINIESRFNKNAVSPKGAVGLMQVLPSTAKGISNEIDVENFDLTLPEDNILFGTFYISKMIDRFGNLETALAGYNAGPTNVSNWLQNSDYSEDGITLKNIPFKETVKYIEKFKQNFKYYTNMMKNI